jgi:CRP-like cAMP-binding protein
MTQGTPPDAAELARYPLFADLGEDRCQQFLEEHRLLRLSAGHQIVFEGDWGDGLFLIRSGIAKVRHITYSGEEVVIALLGAGEMVGEMAMLLGERLRSADVLSLTPMEVVKLRLGPVERTLRTDPALALGLARLQAERLRSLGVRFSLRSEDATTRVLAILLELARCNSYSNDPQAPLPDLSQSEIAALAGLARGTTSKIIGQLRSRGTLVDGTEGLQLGDLQPLRKRGLLPAPAAAAG